MTDYTITIPKEMDKKVKKLLKTGPFETPAQFVVYALGRYLEWDVKTKRNDETRQDDYDKMVDEETLKKMKEALDIEDD